MMRSLPMHVTPIGDGAVLVEPSDSLDPAAADQYIERLGEILLRMGARTLFYDLAHVALVDQVYYAWLVALHRSCHMLGVEFVSLHMRPVTAFALAQILDHPVPFRCVTTTVDYVTAEAGESA